MTHLQYRPEEFVRMRLDETEADARQVLAENHTLRQGGASATLWDEQDALANATLSDVASKRWILDLIRDDLDAGVGVFAPNVERWGRAYLIACALAEPYAAHEDYSHKWARETAS